MIRGAFAFLVLGACLARAAETAEAPDSSDWPTVAHDMQRTNCNPACPQPPLKVRWLWSNGQKLTVTGKDPRYAELANLITVRYGSLSQPMVKGETAYIGTVEGELYAIDLKTGETKWKAPVCGQVLHCVTVGDAAVFVASTRGIDAIAFDGKPLWRFEDPRLDGFYVCPALADGLVLAGSLGGFFYGLDEKTGKVRWAFEAGGPIYHTAAAYNHTVLFGAEDMHLYCLDAGSGKLKWKSEKLPGVSFGHYWPVIAAKAGKVLVRTSPFQKCAGCSVVGDKNVPFDYDKAQEALRAYYEKNPRLRDLFALNLSDGKEPVIVTSSHFGSQGDLSPPPIVYSGNAVPGLADGSVLGWHYAKQGGFQIANAWGAYDIPADFGRINFETGLFERLGPTGMTRPPCITRNDDFHQNTMGGKYLFGMQDILGWGGVAVDGKGPGIGGYSFRGNFHSDLCYGGDGRPDAKHGSVGLGGRCDNGTVCATITAGLVLVNPQNGIGIVALESQGGRK